MRNIKILLIATSVIALTGSGVTAQAASVSDAQDQPSTPPANSSSDDASSSESNSVADIVVTAQRRTETLQRTAASVSVRSGAELQAAGKFALSAILEDVPGVSGGAATTTAGMGGASVGSDSPSAGLTIRGIPSNAGVGGSATSVSTSAAIYVDGIYNGVGSTYDIDRIEVLRGPQGTLYGRSATTGVVAIHTRDPKLDKVEGNLAAEAGNYDLQHFTGAVNVPIVDDKIALRVSGNYYHRDGFETHSVEKGDLGYNGGATTNKDYRAKLLIQPVDDFSLLLGFAGQDNTLYSSGYTLSQTSPNSFTKSYSPVGLGKNSFRQYWAELDWHFGDGLMLTYLPAYRTWRSDADNYIRIPLFPGTTLASDQTISTPKDHFLTQELRLASRSGEKLTWQVGALYYQNTLRTLETSNDGNSGALQFTFDIDKKTTAAGVFGEATYAFTDTTRLNLGLRYDYTKVEVSETYVANTTGGIPGSTTYGFPENLVPYSLSGQRKFNNVTYKVRLEHDLSPQNLVYALTSSGFSPGDLAVAQDVNNEPTTVEFDAETLTAYEIGTKNRFLDNRLQVNGAAFYYIYGGYQVANVNIAPALVTYSAFTTMSTPARAYGGEMEILFQPTHRDRLGLNLSYTRAYFVHRSEQTVTGTSNTFDFYFANKNIPNVVPFRAQVNYDHDFEIGDGSQLTLHGDVRFQGAYLSSAVRQDQVALGANPYARTGPQFIEDITATWTSSTKRLSVSAYLRNLSNNRYKVNTGVNNNGLGGFAATTERYDPRTYGIVVSAKF